MAYTPPNIWYSQDNNLSRAIDSLNQLANEFFIGERRRKEDRRYEVRTRQILQGQRDYGINPYQYGDPFENTDDFNRYMAQINDAQATEKAAINYTPMGGTLSPSATETVASGIDPTPIVLDKNDVAIMESWLLGGTDLAKSSYWSGLVNQEVLLDEDADDLLEKGLLYPYEVDRWSDPAVRNQVKTRFGRWKDKFISENDIYKTDDEFERWATDLDSRKEKTLNRITNEPRYQLAWADSKSYGSRFTTNFGQFDSDSVFEGWRVGEEVYNTIPEMQEAFPLTAEFFGLELQSSISNVEDYVNGRLGGYDPRPGSRYQRYLTTLSEENPQLAGWFDSEARKWFVDVKQARSAVDFAEGVGRDNWAQDLQRLLPAQKTVNGMLDPHVQEYVGIFTNIMSEAQKNPGKFRQQDIEGKLNQLINLRMGQVKDHFSQNPDTVRDVYIQSQGGLENIFQRLVRNYLRQGNE